MITDLLQRTTATLEVILWFDNETGEIYVTCTDVDESWEFRNLQEHTADEILKYFNHPCDWRKGKVEVKKLASAIPKELEEIEQMQENEEKAVG